MMVFRNTFHKTLAPLAPELSEIKVGAFAYLELLTRRLCGISGNWQDDFFPSLQLLRQLRKCTAFEVLMPDGSIIGNNPGKNMEKIAADGIKITYPWDLLRISEMLLNEMTDNVICGTISPAATVEGVLELGENSRILPGVFIEGNCIIGKNCKIGPNCYLRGNTIIGDNCHVGQAVEIKNSIVNSHSNIAHLSYVGDSVIGEHVNFGAGTIVSNLRHDGKNHFSMVDDQLIDTGRRKFGAIVGDNVHTGIHTSVYPGRKLFPGATTCPGAIIKYDLH